MENDMALRINTNTASVFAQKHLSRSQERLASNFEKLSSGLRITKAADDAAGLAVSESMRSDIRSLSVAMRNTNDGISMVQTAESSLSEIGSALSRMRELAVQSASAVLQATERAYLNTEFVAVRAEITRIADVTEFNGLKLSNAAATVIVQVGIGTTTDDEVNVALQDSDATALALNTTVINTSTVAQASIAAIDTAIDSNNSARAAYGSVQNTLTSALHNLESYSENLVAAESRIRDVDFASETADMTRNSIFQQAGVAVLAQANVSPQVALQLLQ
jgi:flagellin